MNKYNIDKSEAEWKAQLNDEEYRVLRQKGTERPHTGKYNLHFEEGAYKCNACGQKLFESDYGDEVDSIASTSRDFYPGLPNPSHSTNKTPCRTIASHQISISNSNHQIEIVPADFDSMF